MSNLNFFSMIIYLCLRLCCTVSSQHIPSKWVPTSVESSGLLPKHSIPFKVYPKYSNHLVNVHSHPTASMYPSLSSIDTNYANYARFPMQTEPIAASHIHNPINLLQPLSPNHSPQHFVPVHGSTSSGRGTRPYVSPVNIHDPNQPIPSVDILRPTAFASSGSFDSYPSPGTTQTAENTSVAGSSCSITYEGLKLDCYVASALYQDKLAQLKHRGMLSNEYATDQFNACDLEVGSDDATVGKARKRRSYTYTILKANSTRASAVKTGPSDIGNGTLVAMHSHAYPQEYPVMYTASPMHSTATRQRTSREELPETNETSSQACFLNAGLTVRKPYHMYNTYGQVRFIVQEEQLQLTQCQPKAICWFANNEPIPLKSDCNNSNDQLIQLAGRFHCDRRLCTHQLLSFDPSDLTKFIFYDEFAFECCCRCQVRALQQPSRCDHYHRHANQHHTSPLK